MDGLKAVWMVLCADFGLRRWGRVLSKAVSGTSVKICIGVYVDGACAVRHERHSSQVRDRDDFSSLLEHSTPGVISCISLNVGTIRYNRSRQWKSNGGLGGASATLFLGLGKPFIPTTQWQAQTLT